MKFSIINYAPKVSGVARQMDEEGRKLGANLFPLPFRLQKLPLLVYIFWMALEGLKKDKRGKNWVKKIKKNLAGKLVIWLIFSNVMNNDKHFSIITVRF